MLVPAAMEQGDREMKRVADAGSRTRFAYGFFAGATSLSPFARARRITGGSGRQTSTDANGREVLTASNGGVL